MVLVCKECLCVCVCACVCVRGVVRCLDHRETVLNAVVGVCVCECECVSVRAGVGEGVV